MLVFAYDGSLNGDWIAHYAVRFALATPARLCRNSKDALHGLPRSVARWA